MGFRVWSLRRGSFRWRWEFTPLSPVSTCTPSQDRNHFKKTKCAMRNVWHGVEGFTRMSVSDRTHSSISTCLSAVTMYTSPVPSLLRNFSVTGVSLGPSIKDALPFELHIFAGLQSRGFLRARKRCLSNQLTTGEVSGFWVRHPPLCLKEYSNGLQLLTGRISCLVVRAHLSSESHRVFASMLMTSSPTWTSC